MLNLKFYIVLLLAVSRTLAVNRSSECSQHIVADRPVVISSNNDSKECNYVISVPSNTLPDHVFQVSLLTFIVGHRSLDGNSCSDGWALLGDSNYCGNNIPPGTLLLFPTSRHRHQLEMVIKPGKKHQFQARIELLPRLTLQEKHPEMILATPGEHVKYTDCDRIYNCLQYPGYCQITSPGFPGVYSRPLNCSYYLKSPEPGIIIGGRHELFEVGDHHKITHNCDNDDHIAIYDSEQLIGKFCGKSKKFPKIVSKTNEIVVRFISTKAGPPLRGFVISVERSPPHLTENVKCFETIRVGNTAVQQLKSPHHWLAPGSHCSYTLVAKQGKQIWLLLTNIKTRGNCSSYDDHVTIYDGNDVISVLCNNTEPQFPIVSKSNQIRIIYNSPNGTLDATSKFYFNIKYSSVNNIETGEHIKNSWCDMIFNVKTSGSFSLLNPRDIILYNPKYNNLTCKYYFSAPESYTVRLQLDHSVFEPLYKCHSIIDSCSSNYDRIIVTEKYTKNVLGCECGARKHSQIFQSKGSELILTLTLNLNYDLVNSSLKYSPELYRFQGRYLFIPPSDDSLHCGNYNMTKNSLEFPYKYNNLYITTPIMCNWKLNNITSLKIVYLHLPVDCTNNYVVIQYNNSTDLKLCNGDDLPTDLQQSSQINIYLISNRGHPRLNLLWNHDNLLSENEKSDEICYSPITLSLFMIAAAVCTMVVVLIIALIVWRYHAGQLFSTWRRQRYSSVTRNNNPSFW